MFGKGAAGWRGRNQSDSVQPAAPGAVLRVTRPRPEVGRTGPQSTAMKPIPRSMGALAGVSTLSLCLAVPPPAAAQTPVTLTTWDLTGEPGNQVVTLASHDAPHVQGSPLMRGSGVVPTAGLHSMSASGWHDLASDDYFSLGFVVEPGYRVDLAELQIATRASNTGPANAQLRSSVDGFAAVLATLSNQASGATSVLIDLHALTGLTGAFELRLYAADATSVGGGTVGSQGSMRITRYASAGSTFPVELRGTVTAGGIGEPYCGEATANSTGQVGVASAVGSPVRAQDDVTLWATELPKQSFGYFLTSRQRGLALQPGGSAGVLCLGGAIGRYVGPGQVKHSGAAGSISLAIDLDLMPTPSGTVAAAAGETWHFQAWFRDGSPTGATSNFTNGHSVTFL